MLSRVHGQPEGVRFLQRVVEGTLTRPLILAGPDGVGRRYAVREAAREMFGSNPAHGYQLDRGIHPDFVVVERDGEKDIGVEAARNLVGLSKDYPSVAPFRFFVVDGVDHMTTAAANALLKTLEEPPQRVRFFLLAEQYDGVISTIQSRCGRVRFFPLDEAFLLGQLKFESNPDKAVTYARLAEGSAGRAVSFWGSGRIALRDKVISLFKLALAGDVSTMFSQVDGLADELSLAFRFYGHILSDVALYPITPDRITNVDRGDEIRDLAGRLTPERQTRIQSGYRRLQRLRVVNFPLQFKTHLATDFK